MIDRPRIVLTVADTTTQSNPELAARKNELYAEALRRHGAEPVALDARSAPEARRRAFETMSGLLLTGGADVEPSRYGQPNRGSVDIDAARDDLEAEAWAAAERRNLPVLGICRGLQAVNVFAGGTLLQDVDGHAGPGYGSGSAATHPIRLLPGTRLARILSPTNVGGGTLIVNSYHHQAVRRSDLAPGLTPSAVATSGAAEIVEGLEGGGERLVLAVQCHPERQESTPAAFERLWRVFVDACRGAAEGRAERAATAR